MAKLGKRERAKARERRQRNEAEALVVKARGKRFEGEPISLMRSSFDGMSKLAHKGGYQRRGPWDYRLV